MAGSLEEPEFQVSLWLAAHVDPPFVLFLY
jgi:hypothetical protein